MNELTMLLNADPFLLSALREDISSEDVTTNAVMKEAVPGEVDLLCKQDGVIAGLGVFARVFTLLDPKTSFEAFCKDGDRVEKGDVLCTLHARTEESARTAGEAILAALTFSSAPAPKARLLYALVTPDGVADLDM